MNNPEIGTCIIISADIVDVTNEVNAQRSSKLLYDILTIVGHDALVIPCDGMYNGVQEQCYLVKSDDLTLLKSVSKLGYKYKQECFLFISDDHGTINEYSKLCAETFSIKWHDEEPEDESWTKVINKYFTLEEL